MKIEGNLISAFKGCGVDDYSDSNSDSSEYDGLIGLTPQPHSSDYDLLVDLLFTNGRIPARIFSTKYENQFGDTYIYFGGYESGMVESNLIYTPLYDETDFWSIKFTHVQPEGFNKILNSEPSRGAILDTGTTLTYFIPRPFMTNFFLCSEHLGALMITGS